MTITSTGYPTDIGKTNIDWALMHLTLGRPYWTSGSAVRVTPKTDGTRQVNISAGSFGGMGIYDYNNSVASLTLPSVSSGTRWFGIGAERNWNNGSVGTSFVVFGSGATSNATIPTRDADGTTAGGSGKDVQPLALVPLTAGDTVPGTPIDLRAITYGGNIYVAKDERVLQYLGHAGQQDVIGNVTWTHDGFGWSPDREVVRSGPGYGNPLGVASGGTGWATVSELVSKGTRDGNVRQLLLVARKSGGDIVIGAAGNVSGGDLTALSVTNTQWRPPHDIPGVQFEYKSNATGGSTSGTFGGTARYTTNGNLIIISGTPNTRIDSMSQGEGWTIRAQIQWIQEN